MSPFNNLDQVLARPKATAGAAHSASRSLAVAATLALTTGTVSAADQTIDGTLTVGSGAGGGLVVNGLAPAPTPVPGTVRVSGGEIKAYGDIQTFSSIYGSGLLRANTSSAFAPWQVSKVNAVLTDYCRNVILLHEYYTSTLLNPNACVGEFVMQRGTTASLLRTSIVRVSSHSAYNNNHQAIASQGEIGALARCSYGGKTYLALVVPFSASRLHSIEFSGYSISTAPERLTVVPYYNQNTSTVLNAEINSSLVILDANTSQTYNYSTTTFTGGTAPGVPAATEVQLGGGSVAIGSTLKASGATTLSSSLGVTGPTTLSSTLGVTGALSVGGSILPNNINGINSGASNTLVRLSGGAVDQGAVLLLGGPTNTTIPNMGQARVGSTDIWRWDTNGVRVASGKTLVVGANNNAPTGAAATDILQVNGGAFALKLTVAAVTGWADTVFAADYRLPPLEEVAAHIAEKKHLPGIPSEAEIAAKGIDTADMLKRQMAKIEELTLYAIEAEKRAAAAESAAAEQLATQSADLAAQVRENEQQSKELAALRARLAAIEAALLPQLKP